jgi:hypothetical protein
MGTRRRNRHRLRPSEREVDAFVYGRSVRVRISRAVEEEIDRESFEYELELSAAERASPEVEQLNRRYAQKVHRPLAEAEEENRQADAWRISKGITRDLEERYQRQLKDEGLLATPRYEKVSRDATEIAGRPGHRKTAGRPRGDNATIRAELGDESGDAGIRAALGDNPHDADYGVGATVEQGSSGQDAGRPKFSYERTIDGQLTVPGGRPIEEWKRAFGSGRRSPERPAERAALRAELAPLLIELIGPPGVLKRGGYVQVPKAPIAGRLGVKRKAINTLLSEHAEK